MGKASECVELRPYESKLLDLRPKLARYIYIEPPFCFHTKSWLLYKQYNVFCSFCDPFSSSTRPAPHLLTALAPLLRGGPDTLHARADLAKISIFGFFSLFYCCPAVPANLACANHHRGKKLVLLFTAQSKLPGNSSPAVRNDWTQALRTPATRRIKPRDEN